MITVTARLTEGTDLTAAHPGPTVTPRITGGLYLGSNGDPRTKLPTGGIVSQYHSIGQTGPAIYPGYTWVPTYLAAGGWLNLILELLVYGTPPTTAQTFTVEGVTWTVPAPTGYVTDPASATKAVTKPAWSYRQILAGHCNGLLHRALAAVRPAALAGYRINLQLASEVDTDNQGGHRDSTTGATPMSWAAADYLAVQAYTYIISWMQNPPAGIRPLPPGVTFSLGWAGQWSGRDAFARCHPETLPVDYMAWNSYNHGQNWAPAMRLAETSAYRGSVGPRMRALPVLIPEWGTNANWPGGQAAYISAWPSAILAHNLDAVTGGWGPYVATVYFGSRDRTWGKLDPEADGLAALNAAYRHRTYHPFTA